MANEIKDGGSAFPNAGYDGPDNCADPVPGMTLRDWFAGQALAGIINACAMDTRRNGESMETMFARKAYYIADAMLAAREWGEA